jgi:hypothetical protein
MTAFSRATGTWQKIRRNDLLTCSGGKEGLKPPVLDLLVLKYHRAEL